MTGLYFCARRPGLCEPWGRVFCDPAPGQVTRMIALPGQSCAGWYPADMLDMPGCEPLPPGECPEVFRRGCDCDVY